MQGKAREVRTVEIKKNFSNFVLFRSVPFRLVSIDIPFPLRSVPLRSVSAGARNNRGFL